MEFMNILRLHELLFCMSMVSAILWMCTGQYILHRSDGLKWVHTLNRYMFWCWTSTLTLSLIVIACL